MTVASGLASYHGGPAAASILAPIQTIVMLSSTSLAFLKRLLDTPGPSGFETNAARVWRDEAKTFAQNVKPDVAGNSMAEVNPGGSPTIMLDGGGARSC